MNPSVASEFSKVQKYLQPRPGPILSLFSLIHPATWTPCMLKPQVEPSICGQARTWGDPICSLFGRALGGRGFDCRLLGNCIPEVGLHALQACKVVSFWHWLGHGRFDGKLFCMHTGGF